MNLRTIIFIVALLLFVGTPTFAADTTPPSLTAKAYAVYGWKNGVPTPLYVKNENTLYPVASITKLITAKAVEALYPSYMLFAMTPTTLATDGSIKGMVARSQFTRDDLLKALLIPSSNDAAMAFMDPVGQKKFLATMNTILHEEKYTTTSFVNPSGLDPTSKKIAPNRLTPYHISALLSDIYQHDPVLTAIMGEADATITDLYHHTTITLRQSDGLYLDDTYKGRVIIGKTGFTNLAGQNLAFITQGNDTYDYITIVVMHSKDRVKDSEKVLDWLDALQQPAYGG
ncbi:MAG TPA: hypothetical protein VG621_03410 [Candidatus Paceibacterota bacterium]|nr:hypothetical protein [Candidatus Paceibacterota bacterium]